MGTSHLGIGINGLGIATYHLAIDRRPAVYIVYIVYLVQCVLRYNYTQLYTLLYTIVFTCEYRTIHCLNTCCIHAQNTSILRYVPPVYTIVFFSPSLVKRVLRPFRNLEMMTIDDKDMKKAYCVPTRWEMILFK